MVNICSKIMMKNLLILEDEDGSNLNKLNYLQKQNVYVNKWTKGRNFIILAIPVYISLKFDFQNRIHNIYVKRTLQSLNIDLFV